MADRLWSNSIWMLLVPKIQDGCRMAWIAGAPGKVAGASVTEPTGSSLPTKVAMPAVKLCSTTCLIETPWSRAIVRTASYSSFGTRV